MYATSTTTVGPNTSMRDKLLTDSSPIRNLLLSILIIALLFCGVFISWIYFRRKTRGNIQSTMYGELFEVGDDLEIVEDAVGQNENNNSSTNLPGDPLKVDIDAKDSRLSLPDAIMIGLARSKEDAIADRAEVSTEPPVESCSSESAKVNDRLVDLSIEALIATHKRQADQRERFIHDRRNIGLRHMALEQIRMQQKYEKQIMRIKTKRTSSKV